MSNRSAKAISADSRYDNFVKDHVTKHSRRMISFSIRDETVHVNGDKDSLNLLDSFPELSVKDLILKLKELGESGDQSLEYADSINLSTQTSLLPPMRFAFCGPSWNHVNARKQLTEYFCILGFGKAKNDKKFGKDSSMPEWWPDSLSWANFGHPGKGTIPNINKILESMFQHYGLDIQTYHSEDLADIDQQRPKRRKRKSSKNISRRFIESDNDRQQETTNNNDIINTDAVDADLNDAPDLQYEAPFPYVPNDTHLKDTQQPQQPHVEEPVPMNYYHESSYPPPDNFQFYNNSYVNYPSYPYNYDYSNQHYFAAQPQSQQPTTSSGETSVNDAIREARTYCEL